MNAKKQNLLRLYWGFFIALSANVAVIAVTIWESKNSTDNDLWFSTTFVYVFCGATLLALCLGLPLNMTALCFYLRKRVWPQFIFSIVGVCYSISPWIMPVVVERIEHSNFYRQSIAHSDRSI